MNHLGVASAGQGTHNSSSSSSAAATPGSAALQGASLAFQKQKDSEKQAASGAATLSPSSQRGGHYHHHHGNGTAGDNDALVAATLSTQSTGGSATGLPDMDSPAARNIVAARLQQWGHHSAGLSPQQQQHQHPQFLSPQQVLHPPGQQQQQQQHQVGNKSPSFIAATLAASRSASPHPPAPTTPRRKPSVSATSMSTATDAVDSEPIPPTGSLISMFEQGKGDARSPGDPVKKMTPKRSSIDVRLRDDRHIAPISTTAGARSPVAAERSPTTAEKPNTQKTSKPKPLAERSVDNPVAERPLVAAKPMDQKKPAENPVVAAKPVDQKKQAENPVVAAKPTAQKKPAEKPLVEKPSINETVKPAKAKPRPSTPPPKPAVLGVSPPVVLSPTPKRSSKPALKPQLAASATGPASSTSRPTQQPTPMSVARQRKPGPEPEPQARPIQQITAAPLPPRPRGTNKPGRAQQPASSSEPVLEGPLRFINRTNRSMTSETNDSFVSALSSQEPSPEPSPPTTPRPIPVPPLRKNVAASAPSSPTRGAARPQRLNTQSSQNLNLNSLTSAIVAGSLATARMTPSNTGSSLPPPLPKRQRSPRLKQTLRKAPSSSDEEDDRHKKGHHRPKLRSGKHHAHHEGARKKWRDEIRERERKRYEAVWASNRGMLLPAISVPIVGAGGGTGSKDYTNCVANVVAREIWRRSRLPEDELAEVWDLVDRDKKGALDKQEFVVGLWLIDQRLKGRRLPPKVSDSVWGSVNGLRVKRPHKGR